MSHDFSDPMTHMEQLAVELLRAAIQRDVDAVASRALDIKIVSKTMEIDANADAVARQHQRVIHFGEGDDASR